MEVKFLCGFLDGGIAIGCILFEQEQHEQACNNAHDSHGADGALKAYDQVAAAEQGHDPEHYKAQQQGCKAVHGVKYAVYSSLLVVVTLHADALHHPRPEGKAARKGDKPPDKLNHKEIGVSKHQDEAQSGIAPYGSKNNRLRLEFVCYPASGQV